MDTRTLIAERLVSLVKQRSDLWNPVLDQIRYKKLAALAGLAGPTIERMVDGGSSPTVTTLEAVAGALGVPVEALLLPQEEARLLADYRKLPEEGRELARAHVLRLHREMMPVQTFSLYRTYPPSSTAGLERPAASRVTTKKVPLKRVGINED